MLGAWVLFCYGFALGLPFFFDDLPVMTWIKNHTWCDAAFSHEGGYYRPLVFLVYKWGQLFSMGVRQPVLHAVNLALLWASAWLIIKIVYLCERKLAQALLAALLFVAFPFLSQAIPWVTSLPHPLVTTLTLLATYAALLAEEQKRLRYWAISLLATALAPLAHENGAVTGLIVGGLVLMQYGLRPERRRWGAIAAGVLLNVALVMSRSLMPGVDSLGSGSAFSALPQNYMYFLQGLLYPVAPLAGWAVRRWQWRDFTLLGLLAVALALLLAALAYRRRRWRWIARGVWWWGLAALPAAASLPFGTLFISARLYTFAAPGIAMLWASLIAELAEWWPRPRWRRVLAAGLAVALLIQSVAYLRHREVMYHALDGLYTEVLAVAADEGRAPLGFINVPAALTWQQRVYPLVTDDVLFVPWTYSNLGEFIEVNLAWRDVGSASCGALFQQTDPAWLSQGPWLEGGAMRDFLASRRTNWLGRYDAADGRWRLLEAGAASAAAPAVTAPLARFEGGPMLASAAIEPGPAEREWRIVLEWWAGSVADATVFVHVRDAAGNMAAQADGAALGGVLPLGAWQVGDRVRDVRYATLPAGASTPCTVLLGLYKGERRFPAFVGNERAQDDAVPIGAIP